MKQTVTQALSALLGYSGRFPAWECTPLAMPEHTDRMTIPATALGVGMTILDGTRRTPVKKVQRSACSSGGTHVNNGVCYDVIGIVTVAAVNGRPKISNFSSEKA